jgi:hypothetical protein
MIDEQRSVAVFLAQPEGLPLFSRPAASEIAWVGPPHSAIAALPDKKTVTAGLTQVL